MGNVPDFCRNTTLITNTTYETLSECWTEKRIADFLRVCLPLIILPISLISNTLSFLALRSRQMRGTSTAFFMLALSFLDPLVLLTKNFVYFPTFFPANSISCKILYFLIYVLGYTNVWILVIMTADKFFAVWFPLKASYFCTITRAKYICIFLLILTSIISFHHFWTIDSLTHPQNIDKQFCYYDMRRYDSLHSLWRYTDFVFWCFLPFILLLSLSILIIYKLHQKRNNSQENIRQIINTNIKFREADQRKRSSVLILGNHDMEMRSNQKTEVIRSRHRHITLMLLSVAGVFLLLTLPNSIYFVLDIRYGFSKSPKVNDYNQWLRYRRLTILTVIMFQLSDLQHAANFFLYLLTSDKFRRSVINICITIIEILPTLLTCSCQRKIHEIRYSNQKFDKSQYNMSSRSSVCGMSNIIQGSRHIQNQAKPLYIYHAIITKSATTKIDL
ncbi:unnamed protein product [Adineta steineri]|uniref:G-protein coupled receptors family 1 profile domain-containing protein n=1 Tax=Adineta steineri TaxID=433720 RepID=A0A814X6A1_9BILA|nr:unnamed protein product [Adineta steineri]CAF1211573.1 unnamed protein product [Adineta steineri]